MRRLLIAFAVAAFVAAGAAQSTDAGPQVQEADQDLAQPNLTVNQTGDHGDNHTHPEEAKARGESASFDAQLMTAIQTLDRLTAIAPNDDVEQRLERALEILRGVQEDTDTASLGPDNRTDADTNETEEAKETESGEQGPPEDRGPSGDQGGGPPGFVGDLIGGLFG